MNKKIVIFSAILLVSVLVLVGIMGASKTEKPKSPEITENQPAQNENEQGSEEEEELPKVVPTNINPLTGIGDMSEDGLGGRPVAVMINNVEKALPQYGVAQADLIFEIPVEGNLTRLMALYADYTTVPYIVSVRSARDYFPAFSEGFDAIYICWGSADGTEDYMKSLGVDDYNGFYYFGTLFSRDQEKLNNGYSKEHTSSFDGPGLVAMLDKEGVRTEIEEDKSGNFFSFYPYYEFVRPSTEKCEKMHIEFGSVSATLTYDEKSNTYLKDINEKPHMDGITGTQLAFSNVFLLETKITLNADGEHKDVTWKVDMAEGYYLSGGYIKKIYWTKASESEKLLFFDENGNELTINRGKSYIAITTKGKTTFE